MSPICLCEDMVSTKGHSLRFAVWGLGLGDGTFLPPTGLQFTFLQTAMMEKLNQVMGYKTVAILPFSTSGTPARKESRKTSVSLRWHLGCFSILRKELFLCVHVVPLLWVYFFRIFKR